MKILTILGKHTAKPLSFRHRNVQRIRGSRYRRSASGFQHCSKKWWKRVFFHLLDVTMVNAFVIYKPSRHHKVTHLAFMVDVVKGLLQKSGTDLGIERNFPGTITPFRLIGRNHFPEPTGKKLDCCLCSNRRTKWKQSSYQCESCKVTLSIYPCFRNYHKFKNI